MRFLTARLLKTLKTRLSIDTLSDNYRGALFMMLAMAGYVFNDTLMKLSSSDMWIFQAIFIRGFFVTLFMAVVAKWQGSSLNPLRHMSPVVLLRVTAEIVGTVCFLVALVNIPIANATAILQATPFVLTLAAALFFGEKVGWQRYLAIIMGFIGVMIIVRPGVEGFNAYSLLVLTTVFTVVIRDLATQKIAISIPTSYLAYLTALFITIMGGLVTLIGVLMQVSFQMTFVDPWTPLSFANLALIAGAACFLIVGYVCGIKTMRVGEISFIAPFRYTVLIWAILIGIFVFDDIPDLLTLIGCIIVVVAGVFSFYRERYLSKQQEKAVIS